MATCVLCQEPVDLHHPNSYAILMEKGCNSINKASKLHKLDVADLEYSEEYNLYVHKICRNNYINPKTIPNFLKQESSINVVQKNL